MPRTPKTKIFYGDIICQSKVASSGKDCTHGAYYKEGDRYLCGSHSNKKKRVMLEKNTKAKNARRQEELLTHEQLIVSSAEERRKQGKKGQVACSRMQMMKEVPLVREYRNVFPNNKHQNRADGYGCASLSPMRLGPVHHNEPDLPIALNIENYHQYSKVWPTEVDETGAPSKEFRELQVKGFADPVPHRHKFSSDIMKKLRETVNGENRNQPLYSVHNECRFTYVESRYFYCHFYGQLAKETADFKKLQEYLDNGINLMIVGYDSYKVTKDLYEHYIDPTKPFGHELVLYSLLVISEPAKYPWNMYREKYPHLYSKHFV